MTDIGIHLIWSDASVMGFKEKTKENRQQVSLLRDFIIYLIRGTATAAPPFMAD